MVFDTYQRMRSKGTSWYGTIIDDDEMDHILELFHSENDDDLLGVDLHMI